MLRNIVLAHIVAFCVLSCQFGNLPMTADKSATKETKKLYQNLKKLVKTAPMFGHQDALAYGVGWSYINGQSDVKRVCGEYPAVFGWEIGHIELGASHNLDSVPFEKIKEYIVSVHNMGAVNTISWHANNPLTGGTSWDCTGTEAVASVVPGGAQHMLYKNWLDRLAQFFNSLTDSEGKPIPVLFRPFHEHTGNWFWWGKAQCTPLQYKELWHFTVHYLQNEKHVHNLLYVYSTTDAFSTPQEYFERYPDDEYIDILGFDCYAGSNSEPKEFINLMRSRLGLLAQFAKERNKIAAIAETGIEQIPVANWWTDVFYKAIEGFPVSYVLFWRNAHNIPGHYFVPYPGQVSAGNFLLMHQTGKLIFQPKLNSVNIYK